MTYHQQVPTSREGVEVDEGIKDLVEALWACGLDTEYSCQGDLRYWEQHGPDVHPVLFRHQGYLQFTTFASGVEFVRHSEPVLDASPIPEQTALVLQSHNLWINGPGPRKGHVKFFTEDLPLLTTLWQRRATTTLCGCEALQRD